ncbi:hypothetical protein EDC04DRAFT_2613667 [Pisolithus marmoratus]|nr:hypothetical protein EDC04DRAFT_2613667 [Pisolithus marmoratus]
MAYRSSLRPTAPWDLDIVLTEQEPVGSGSWSSGTCDEDSIQGLQNLLTEVIAKSFASGGTCKDAWNPFCARLDVEDPLQQFSKKVGYLWNSWGYLDADTIIRELSLGSIYMPKSEKYSGEMNEIQGTKLSTFSWHEKWNNSGTATVHILFFALSNSYQEVYQGLKKMEGLVGNGGDTGQIQKGGGGQWLYPQNGRGLSSV